MTEAVLPPVDEALPSDPVELRAVAAMLLVERNAALERCEKLERLLKLANALRYGPSSEKVHPDQLQLGLEDIDQAVGAADATHPVRATEAVATRARNRNIPSRLAGAGS